MPDRKEGAENIPAFRAEWFPWEMVILPRRSAVLLPNIPLVLVAYVIRMEVEDVGERLDRIVIERASRHFYNLAFHTQPLEKELPARRDFASVPGNNRMGL
jgi:hypothetical protein